MTFRIGVTVGKFYPFHLGHLHLLKTMAQECDFCYVILATKEDQTITGQDRFNMIYNEMPDNCLLEETADDVPDDSEAWAKKTWNLIDNFSDPDLYKVVVYTSEAYGETWAAAMGVEHRFVGREDVPISGTEVRAEPYKHFDMLPLSTQKFLTFQVTVIGPESSGKTTLCKALAEHYQTVWVPEYGRYYTEGMSLPLDLTMKDFRHIGDKQSYQNIYLREKASNGIIICDTDKLQTAAWAQRYLGEYPPELEPIVDNRTDLYILCKPDFDWVQDGTRESKEYQSEMYDFLYDKLTAAGKTLIRSSGTLEERLFHSTYMIDLIRNRKNFQ